MIARPWHVEPKSQARAVGLGLVWSVGLPSAAKRPGLTLLEVIIAMAIFLIALGAIVPLIQMGAERALEVQMQATALEKCQSKLSELITGSEALSSQSDTPFPDNGPDEIWMWSCDATSMANGIENLWFVTVTVHCDMGDGKIAVSVSQMMVDPSIRGAPTPATSTSSTTTSGTTGG